VDDLWNAVGLNVAERVVGSMLVEIRMRDTIQVFHHSVYLAWKIYFVEQLLVLLMVDLWEEE